jgi:hypothetical protein
MAAAEATLTRVLDDAADARVEAVKGCPLAGLDDAPSTATPYPPRVTEPDQPNAAAQGAMMRGVEDFPVRPDDDELLVEEFEMLELQPRAHARTAKPHPPPRDARPRDHATRTGRQDRPPTRLLQRPHNRRRILGQLNRGESRHDLARQVRAAPAAAQLLGARRSASRAGRPALGRHVTRDQPSGGARCVLASEPSRLLSRPVHSLRRQAERATVPGDAFESSPSYVLFSA